MERPAVTQQARSFWDEKADLHQVKYESINQIELRDDRSYMICDGNLNFATTICSEDETEYSNSSTNCKKAKISRQDPMSHRIIEKRRRDRMNNCLADLSRLIPSEYLKKGRGRVEKTEIIEMAIKYMKHLQQLHVVPLEQYSLGYQECMSETMRFLVEIEGHFPRDPICVRLLNHLQIQCDLSSQNRKMGQDLDESPINGESENGTKMMDCYQDIKSIKAMDDHKHDQTYDSYNNHHQQLIEEADMCKRKLSDADTLSEKNLSDSNGSASYKYKTNIKLRFSQDLNRDIKMHHHNGSSENRSSSSIRRTSLTSLENYSSSHSSPPSSNSDIQMRIFPTEMETIHDRTNGTIQNGYYPKMMDIHGKHQIPKNSTRLHERRNNNFNVPIFALHAKGSFYVPLTISYSSLLPFMQNYNLIDVQAHPHGFVLHPVTINVNFQPDISRA